MIEWIPEQFPQSGGLAAEGFYRLLGRPRLDPLTVLVRETAQNSWDARLNRQLPVAFSLDGVYLDHAESRALRDDLFIHGDRVVGTQLSRSLDSRRIRALHIQDRNTKGLGGPLRADRVALSGTYDWVDFVLNVGKSNTQGMSGGTYGFGKTITYIVSRANAVIIYSKPSGDRTQSRLIACAIGTEFDDGGRKYTGRHWWGHTDDGSPIPLLGADADTLAERIGIPPFGTGSGTTISIVDPDFGDRSPHQAMRFIAESALWHLWPKMMPRDGLTPMDITVSWEGESVPVPTPSERPPLHGFARALTAIHAGPKAELPPGAKRELVECRRPRAIVGDLVTLPLLQRDRVSVDDGGGSPADETLGAAAIGDLSHHVALLRAPELVVEYLEGPAPPEGGMEWAGVFLVRREFDEVFSQAEPPTHDSWAPELLPKGPGKTIVNVGLRNLRQILGDQWDRGEPRIGDVEVSTSRVANALASLVTPVDGNAPSPSDGAPSGGRASQRRARVDLIDCGPVVIGTDVGTQARLAITPRMGSAATRVSVTVGVALEGSGMDAALDGELRLVEVTMATGEIIPLSGHEAEFVCPAGSEGPSLVELRVRRGRSTAVMFALEVEAVAE